MHKPLVSIITPSYNQAPFLERTILSVLNQSYENIEYIIVDGKSTDDSHQIIEKYRNNISTWIKDIDQGQTDAINKGFAAAKGEIIAWINSDDTYELNAVEEAVSFFQSHSDVGLVYGDAHYIDEHDHVRGDFPAAQTDSRRLRQGYVHIPQQASFFRKNIWDQVGPLDPDFFFAMDYDLWVRIAAVSKIVYHPRLWANFRIHKNAKTIFADDQCWPEMLKVHRREGGSWFSIIYLKYLIRKMAAPIIRWRRQRLFK